VAGQPHGLFVPEDATDDAFISLYWALFCNDTSTWPRGAQPYVADVARNLRRYPLNGDVLTNVKPCAFWSLPRSEPDIVVENRVPALLVQNEWDRSTPGTMGQELHRALRGSRLVMVKEATEHEVFPDGSRCALDAVNAYLTTGVLPARDIVCAPEPSRG
jgi:pimeloyl-ACP methyl ester carboxylesterase